MTAAHTRHTYMCHGGLLSRYLLLTRPVRYLYRYRCYTCTGIAHKLFVLPSFSFATAVLQLQSQCSGSGHAARSAARSAACCVLRALRAAAVCRSCSCGAAVLFNDVVVVVVVRVRVHTLTLTDTVTSAWHSAQYSSIYICIIYMFCLCVPMRDARCMIRASCIVSIWYILYIEDY